MRPEQILQSKYIFCSNNKKYKCKDDNLWLAWKDKEYINSTLDIVVIVVTLTYILAYCTPMYPILAF